MYCRIARILKSVLHTSVPTSKLRLVFYPAKYSCGNLARMMRIKTSRLQLGFLTLALPMSQLTETAASGVSDQECKERGRRKNKAIGK